MIETEIINNTYLFDIVEKYKEEIQRIFQTFDIFIDKLNRLEFNDYQELNIAKELVKVEVRKVNAIMDFLNRYCKEPWVKGLLIRHGDYELELKKFKIWI